MMTMLTLVRRVNRPSGVLMLALLTGVGSASALAMIRQPLWTSALAVLGGLTLPAIWYWRRLAGRVGLPLAVLSVLTTLQSLHSVEHIAQWVQRYILGLPYQQSSGILSPLNAEVVHFIWNWSVVAVAAWLLLNGVRGGLGGWLFGAWSLAHALEHLYLFQQYLGILKIQALRGESLAVAQGLPGILGSEGWLSRQGANPTINYVCTLAPQLITAQRLDVHFWWNAGETLLLVAFAWSA